MNKGCIIEMDEQVIINQMGIGNQNIDFIATFLDEATVDKYKNEGVLDLDVATIENIKNAVCKATAAPAPAVPNAAPADPNAFPAIPKAAPVDPKASPADPNATPTDPNAALASLVGAIRGRALPTGEKNN